MQQLLVAGRRRRPPTRRSRSWTSRRPSSTGTLATLSEQQAQIASQQTQLAQQQAQIEQLSAFAPRSSRICPARCARRTSPPRSTRPAAPSPWPATCSLTPGESALTPEGRARIDAFLPVYLDVLFSDAYRGYVSEIIIEGHTDSVGGYIDNLLLSQQRRLQCGKLRAGRQLSLHLRGDARAPARSRYRQRPLLQRPDLRRKRRGKPLGLAPRGVQVPPYRRADGGAIAVHPPRPPTRWRRQAPEPPAFQARLRPWRARRACALARKPSDPPRRPATPPEGGLPRLRGFSRRAGTGRVPKTSVLQVGFCLRALA